MFNKKFIARSRLRFGLGMAIIGSLLTVINMLTFAKVWQPTFEAYGIPMLAVYIILPFGFIISSWFIGYIYDVKGLWKEETSHTNIYLNQEWMILCENVGILSIKLDDLNKKMENIIKKIGNNDADK